MDFGQQHGYWASTTAKWAGLTEGEIDMMEMGHAASERQAEGFSGSANNFVRANLLWYASGACDIENPTCAASIAFDKYYTNTPQAPRSTIDLLPIECTGMKVKFD